MIKQIKISTAFSRGEHQFTLYRKTLSQFVVIFQKIGESDSCFLVRSYTWLLPKRKKPQVKLSLHQTHCLTYVT